VYNGLSLRKRKSVTQNNTTTTWNYMTDGAEPGSPVYRDGTNNYTPGIAQQGAY